MGLVTEQWKFLQDVSKLILFAEATGVELSGGELYRTEEQQKIYVNTGKSKTMNSMHLKRLAIDLNFFVDGNLVYEHPKVEELGKYWESLDDKNQWGGFWGFKDYPHFQRTV